MDRLRWQNLLSDGSFNLNFSCHTQRRGTTENKVAKEFWRGLESSVVRGRPNSLQMF